METSNVKVLPVKHGHESATHNCSACGNEYSVSPYDYSLPAYHYSPRSPCCKVFLWPLQGCQRWALGHPADLAVVGTAMQSSDSLRMGSAES
jgi:hypothetical protein